MINRRDLLRAALATPLLSLGTLPDLGETAHAAPSLRQVVLDTETTGLEVHRAHRIMEIGCVELLDRCVTNRHFHRYLNPERDCEPRSFGSHGLDRAKLEREPRFVEIASELLEFIAGSELIIHNAPYDIGFLEYEWALIGVPLRVHEVFPVIDTLTLARERYPGQRNNLAVLCQRYGIDQSHQEIRGALLNAHITADVYLAMTADVQSHPRSATRHVAMRS